ncbi:MAG: ferrous iron transport protein A [Clostridia bacterium]|nr:ferrous iron transport protein A [Clostridia bacterium]
MDTLRDLKPKESAIITQMNSQGKIKRRLIDMGITPGTRICMQRTAPLGDPVEFWVRGYKLSIRKSEAKKIYIEKV